uniref:Uncharacterized protein n=1 Tax=Rhizophora mucronata TaxID=61149 RepID=A0A2P2NXG3_RHIMU
MNVKKGISSLPRKWWWGYGI